MPTKEITESTIKEILRLLSFGLTKGLGSPKEGEMCIEAAICFALGEKHSDNPSCVGEEVRECKIALNDCKWSSNDTRAAGLKRLAIAQLGSINLDQGEFINKLKLNSTRRILPFLIQKHYEQSKDNKLLEFKEKFESLKELDDSLFKTFYDTCNYYNNNYYYNYYYYNNNYYYDYYCCYYYYGDEFLLLIADTILQTLIELKLILKRNKVMKFLIQIEVSGGSELKNDLEKGHVEDGIQQDVFSDEEILSFKFWELPREEELS